MIEPGDGAERFLFVIGVGKQRDDLQSAMALLRKAKVDMPLQFNNFRD